MISRLWHGWTNRENPDAYEQLLRSGDLARIADAPRPAIPKLTCSAATSTKAWNS